MMTIFKLWCDHKHQILINLYYKYDNDEDILANTPPNIPLTYCEAFVKSKSNTNFDVSTSYYVMVVHIIVMFMSFLYITFLSLMNLCNIFFIVL